MGDTRDYLEASGNPDNPEGEPYGIEDEREDIASGNVWPDAELEPAELEAADRAAEAWLRARHDSSWYIGNATELEWREAYAATESGR